jgi:two-component system phosphate regulon sensor histidine kinase PhoR
MPRRLSQRLFLSWLATVFAALALVGFIALNRLHASRFEDEKRIRLAACRLIYETIKDDAHAERLTELRALIVRLAQAFNCRLTVINAEGRVLADNLVEAQSMENHRLRPELVAAAAAAAGTGEIVRWSHTRNEEMLYLATYHERPDGSPLFIRLAAPAADLKKDLDLFDGGLLLGLAAVLAATVLLARLLAAHFGNPLTVLNDFAQALARGRVETRVHTRQTGEYGELEQALCRIADQLAAVQQRAEQGEAKVRAVLESMHDGLLALDARQQIVLANAAAGRLLNFSIAHAENQPFWKMVRDEALLKAITQKSAGGEPTQLEWEPEAGRKLHAVALPLRRGTIAEGLVLIIRDVTREAKYQELRKEFVANVSHELRTPLTVIKGFVETLQSGALHDEVKAPEYLEKMRKRVEQLTNLVDDLLEISRLENQTALPNQGVVNLHARIAAAAETLHAALRKKGQKLSVKIAPDAPDFIGNADYLERAVTNLLDNAIKYAPAGGQIAVSAALVNRRVLIAVSDNGPGIPAADLPRLFERFYRVDKSRSRELGGTGLGLAIVKHIALAHGGSVEVESKVGKGSTFKIFIPLREKDD